MTYKFDYNSVADQILPKIVVPSFSLYKMCMQEKTRREKIGTIVVIIIAIGCVAVLFFTTILPYIMSTSSGRHCSIHEPCEESKKEGKATKIRLSYIFL